MHPDFPLDIAVRAARLDERLALAGLLRPADTPTDPLTAWRISRAADRLERPGLDRDGLAAELLRYHRATADTAALGGTARTALRRAHSSWLPAYRAALEGLDRARSRSAGAAWRRDDVYYGRSAAACEPFLLELGGRVRAALRRARETPGAPGFADRIAEDFEAHLLDRFALALAWTLQADTEVHLAAGARTGDYPGHLAARFADAAGHHDFYRDFPVLGRWLAENTRMLAEAAEELLLRLARDADHIARTLLGASAVREYLSVEPGRSDHHAGARTVAFIDAVVDGGRTARFVCKPRSVDAEAGAQALLRLLRGDGVLDFATRAVLPRSGHGYEEFIPSGRNTVDSLPAAEAVYRELGGHLAVFYVLGGGDLHFENVIVADGHAHICDCETILAAAPPGADAPMGTLLDSVFSTGLLEWPRAGQAGPDELRISGYSGGEAYEMPTPVPKVEEGPFGPKVAHRTGVRVEPRAANRVFLGGELLRPQDFAGAITDGFHRVYEWFRRDPEASAGTVAACFADGDIRFINRSTQVFAQLILAAQHPRALADPLEVDALFEGLRASPRAWDGGSVLAEHEPAALWRMDVPVVTVAAGGRRFVCDHRARTRLSAAASPVEQAARRIRALSPRNRDRQESYIRAALSPGGAPESAAAHLEYAVRLGRWLCRAQSGPGAASPWHTAHTTAGGRVETPVEGDLYLGSAGIALFLAYLDRAAPDPAFRAAAERAVDHAVAGCDTTRIGVFTGLSGAVYTLLHLHRLWGDPGLLDTARRLAARIPALLPQSAECDVFGGAAGAVPVLLALAEAADGDGTDIARLCGDRLLARAEPDGDALSWPLADGSAGPALTGFAHGAGGIGWALIALAARTGREEYADAGLRAFGYESRHFDRAEQDWYDLREIPAKRVSAGRHYANAWCNGSTGIGLSRLAAWRLLDGSGAEATEVAADAERALTATLRNFPRLNNDSLCHGRAGNAELPLRFGEARGEPAFRIEAELHAHDLWRGIDALETSGGDFFPGLMLGLSGLGMHFLRLADPAATPSVLLLDPPPAPDAHTPKEPSCP